MSRCWILMFSMVLGCNGVMEAGPSPDAPGGTDGSGADSTQADAGLIPGSDGSVDSSSPDVPPPTEFDPFLPQLTRDECPFEIAPASPYSADDFRPVTVCESGCDHSTLPAALDAAEPFDEIRLAPGEYRDCIDLRISHIAIVGDGGMAHFVNPECQESNNAILLRSEYVRLSNLRITGVRRPERDHSGTAIRIQGVTFAELSRIWIEDVDGAISANVAGADVVLDQIKVKNSGSIDDAETHQRSILRASESGRFWLSRSVFSHFTSRAWLASIHDNSHVELVCNVVAKPGEDEAEHSLHVFFPERMIMRNNFFHEPYGRIVLYNYDNGSDSDLILDGNVFVFDESERGDFVGNIQSTTRVTAMGNTVVGGEGLAALDGREIVETRDNVAILDRAAAEYEPAPALPTAWPVDRL